MRAQYVLTILLLVLPTQLTGITTTHHDKKTDPGEPIVVAEMLEDEVEAANSSDSAERQRRLVPYMTFYLTRDYNRPSLRQQQYHLVPHTGTNSYPDKYIVTSNYQPKYAETPPILYQPKITYTPFLESNKLPGGFTPMRTPQPIRVQVLRGQQQQISVDEPNYSSIFDKLLQLKQVNPQYVVQPQYPKLNVATQYYTRNYARPAAPSKVVTFENYQSEPRYKAVPAKTFIHTYTPANIDIPTDNKVQNFENFESLKTYSQIPSPVTVKDYDRGVLPVKPYAQISSQSAAERPVKVVTVNQKEPAAYQEDYQKTLVQERPVKVYQTVNQDSYQKLPSQPVLPVKVYQPVNQETYQNGPPVKVYQSLPPVTVEDYQPGNRGEYQKPQSRPVKVYQQIYQDDYQPGDLQKPQPGTGTVYQTITQEVYQQQPQQGMVKPGGDYQPVDTKPDEVVSQPDAKYQLENLPDSKYQPEQLPDGKYQPENLPAGKYQPENLPDYSQTVQGTSDPLRPVYQPIKPYQIGYAEPEMTTEAHTLVATENPHSLSVILKQLQESNTLPQTLTPDNIDNSIKTLVQILNALKHTQKFQRPIVVAPGGESDAGVDEDYEEDVLPGTVTQNFPATTMEGGTPGKPGVDYPAHAQIPQTSFNCKKQRYKGFFGDPDTNCQVWHYCDLNGGQASFLCPNGTIFSQVALTCDWWYNVKCATTTQLYVLNERLYKYILPFTPKFPEDYSGPLVDRYLALKFKEMEEKMKKQKKGKPAKPAEDVQDHERNTLQDIEDESGAETQEHTTIVSPDEKN